jgi:hypothetical protein
MKLSPYGIDFADLAHTPIILNRPPCVIPTNSATSIS